MNYVENVAALLQHCVEKELPIYEALVLQQEYLYNHCEQPAHDMNNLVLDVYRSLGRPKARLLHWPYPLAYFGGLCFDLLALILRKNFPSAPSM